MPPHSSSTDTSSGSETIHGQISRTLPLPLHYWCYGLHGLLLALQIVLFSMLWKHPEHNVTIAFDNNVLTVGLSAFLQAFYTLYTMLLVFVTQRLALARLLSRKQKLTATHDVSSAWAGLGAATTTLWRQTKMAAATRATHLVLLYLACITVLHVASPTVMGFQSYNATTMISIPSNSSWPDSSMNLTAIDMDVAIPLIYAMSSLSGLSTEGLTNNTVYDTFSPTPNMVNASVNANTIQTRCGLLPNITVAEYIGVSYINMTAGMNGIGKIVFGIDPLLAEMSDYPDILLFNLQCKQCQWNSVGLYFVLAPLLQVNDSMLENNVSVAVDLNITYGNGLGELSGPPMTVYIVACSFAVSNHTYNLPIENGKLAPGVDEAITPSQAWSLWTPQEDDSGAELDAMVYLAMNGAQCTYGFCTTSDGYKYSLLGITTNTTNTPLTPYQLENAHSQLATQLIWIASQLGGNGGGFTSSPSIAEATEEVLRWRLNINPIPVISTLSASFILSTVACLMLGFPLKNAYGHLPVEGVTLLELLWTGARKLRCGGIFDVSLAKELDAKEMMGAEEVPLLNPRASNVRLEGGIQEGQVPKRRHYTQRQKNTFLLSQRHWCYALHIIFVLLHVVLLLMLIHHPEHHVVIESINEVSTTVLAESLQLFYVLYTLILVFLSQQLTLSRVTTHKHTLTHLHDVSQAWTGLGSSIAGLWQQIRVAASARMTLAITVYFVCVSVLHIASTTVIQFEAFSSNSHSTVLSSLGWSLAFGNATYNWGSLSLIVPLQQLQSLSTNGLVDNFVYDTPSFDATSILATVNATAIHANCGLLSDLTIYQEYSGKDLDTISFSLNATVPNVGTISVRDVVSVWKDTIAFLPSSSQSNNLYNMCSICYNYLFYMVTAGLDVDDSLLGGGISVPTNWTYTPTGGSSTVSQTTTYIVACSLNATTKSDVLFAQNNSVASSNQPSSVIPSQSWSFWSPGGMPALGSQISAALYGAYENGVAGRLSIADVYTMSLLGMNASANAALSPYESSTNPSVTLSPAQFEDAVAKVAAQCIWAASHTNSRFGPGFGTGESVVTGVVHLWRLNINTIPVVVASAASIMLFVLAIYMVGVAPSEPSTISELGVLQALWLEAHSEALHERMLQVEHPTLPNLRVAGMFDVCIADEVRNALERQSDRFDEELSNA